MSVNVEAGQQLTMITDSVGPGSERAPLSSDFSYDITSMSAQICKLAADNKRIIYAHYIMRVYQTNNVKWLRNKIPKPNQFAADHTMKTRTGTVTGSVSFVWAMDLDTPTEGSSSSSLQAHTFFPSLTLRRRNLHADEVKPTKNHAYLVT